MYNRFFGFREKPFKLIPNPDFLFLGKSHKNALAHLTYAISQGEGFVEITGEVGTGKTTLCRVFLEDLGPDTEAAYIFNSKLNAVQLLKSIHTELGINFSSEDPVDLIQNLNRYLLEKKSAGKTVLLLIDEAQHLGSETLEQLRLLSNLETSKNKLIQIILVGQPELGEILNSFDMRQLRQRISLSCLISPLSPRETQEYIDHRLKIAAQKPAPIFSSSAKKLVHKFSGGVPRRINIICDRALIVAYGEGVKDVDTSIVKTALKELRRPRYEAQAPEGKSRLAFLSVIPIVLGILCFMLMVHFDMVQFNNPFKETRETETPETKTSMAEPDTEQAPPTIISKSIAPIIEEVPEIHFEKAGSSIVKSEAATQIPAPDLAYGNDRQTAFDHILHLWKRLPAAGFEKLSDQIGRDDDYFRMAGLQNNIIVLPIEGGLAEVEKFNFPAILRLSSLQTSFRPYIVLTGVENNYVHIISGDDPENQVKISKEMLLSKISGQAFVTCENIFGYSGVIADSSPKFSVLSVKLLLRQIGFSHIDLSPVYDNDVKTAVKMIQENHRLVADGLVGPRTKLALIKEKKDPSTPFLTSENFHANQGMKQ